MKNILVCLAGAGLAAIAGNAVAQSSVTLYGIVGGALNYTDYRRDAAGHLVALDSASSQSPRFGLRGREELGNGNAAFFQLESGIANDTGALLYNGRLFGRQAMVGLDSKRYGTVALGRISPFSAGAGVFDMWNAIDPFRTAYGIAGQNNTFSAGVIRLDNTLAYKTPVVRGFQAGAMVSAQSASAILTEQAGSGNNNRALATGVSYTAGKLYVTATFDLHKPAVVASGVNAGRSYPNQKVLQVGAIYDAGFAKLHAAFARQRDHSLYSPIAEELTIVSTLDPLSRPDADTYMLGATIPYGEHAFLTSYRVRDGKPFRMTATTTFEADRKVVGVAYLHALSKRTRVHASLAQSRGAKSIAVGQASTDTYNRREMRLGILHVF